MARKKISELPVASSGSLTDDLPLAIVSSGGVTSKVTLGNVNDRAVATAATAADGLFARKAQNLADLSDKEAATGSLLFKFLSAEAVARTVTAVLRDKAVSPLDFGAVGDGVVDDGPAFQKTVDFCLQEHKHLYVPGGYFFNIETTVTVDPIPAYDETPRPAYYAGSFGSGLIMFGDGMAASVIMPRVANGPAFDVNVTDPTPYAYRASQGLNVSQIAFIGDNSVSNASGIRIFNAYQSAISQCHFRNLTATAIKLINGVVGTVPDSGWNSIVIARTWIEGCGNSGDGWGIDATGTPGRNEGSSTKLDQVFIQSCGKNQYFTITGITNANPAVVTVSMNQIPALTSTAAAHPFVEGDQIKIFGVAGMTQVNDVIYTVGPAPTATTFSLYSNAGVPVAIDSTAYGVFARKATVALGVDPIATTLDSTSVVITAVAHGYYAGHMITVAGATATGGLTISGSYRIASVTTDTVTITAASAATSTATGGGAGVTAIFESVADHGEVGYYIPKSGAIRWKGQLIEISQGGYTLNQNCALFIPGDAGLAIGAMCNQVVWENNYRRHVFCTGITNFYAVGSQFHGNDQYRQWRLAEFDGSTYNIKQVLWQNIKVRARYGYGTAFKMTGSNIDRASCRFRGIIWDDHDYYTQKRFENVEFDPIQQDLMLVYASTSILTLRPISTYARGMTTPLRLRGPKNADGTGTASATGEWVAYQPTSTNGVACYNTTTGASGGPALAASTIYNIYLYDNSGTAGLIPSTTAPTIDTVHGYMVMTGDSNYLWVGRAQTDAGSLWTTTGNAFLNPVILPGNQAGTPEFFWHYSVDRKLYVKTGSAPASATGGSYSYWPTFEASKTHDWASIAAGAIATTTITTGVTCSLGDYVTSVSMSIDTGGLVLSGYVSAANTITVVAWNPTAGAIDLASATLRAAYQRR